MELIEQIFFFVFGTIWGSFFNVVIFRIPKNGSLIKPKNSYCPSCKKPIEWYDNIPILSWIILGAKCRKCRKKISARYPIVESTTGILFLLLFLRYGKSLDLIAYLVLFGFLIIIAFIDLDTQMIYNKTTVPLAFLGVFFTVLISQGEILTALLNSILGIAVGAGLLYAIGIFSILVFKKEGMGLGDVYLAGAIGAFLGWKGVLAALFLAIIIGGFTSIALILLKIKNRKDLIPFGPFIVIGCVSVVLMGEQIYSALLPVFRAY